MRVLELVVRGGEDVMYFALRPPPDIGRAAQAVLARAAAPCRPTRPVPLARLHVSLLGVAGPDPEVLAAAERVRARPFRIAFNRLGAWGRGEGVRPVVLWGDEGVIGAEWLHEALEAALRAGPPRTICPHMTLAREADAIPERIVAPVSWWVRDFVLVRSGGGRSEVLGRWPLRP